MGISGVEEIKKHGKEGRLVVRCDAQSGYPTPMRSRKKIGIEDNVRKGTTKLLG